MNKLLSLCLILAACSPSESGTAKSVEASTEPAVVLEQEFVPRVREIALGYKSWTRLGDVPSWAPVFCRAPPPPAPLVSQSRDEESHGRKLYFLYVNDVEAYRDSKTNDQPVEQGFVKESFQPVTVANADKNVGLETFEGQIAMDEGAKHSFGTEGQVWKLGAKSDLFVMYKLARETPNTDAGWVYGTVTTAGEVTSAGRVASCMECHAEAKRDRMFGATAKYAVASSAHSGYTGLQGSK